MKIHPEKISSAPGVKPGLGLGWGEWGNSLGHEIYTSAPKLNHQDTRHFNVFLSENNGQKKSRMRKISILNKDRISIDFSFCLRLQYGWAQGCYWSCLYFKFWYFVDPDGPISWDFPNLHDGQGSEVEQSLSALMAVLSRNKRRKMMALRGSKWSWEESRKPHELSQVSPVPRL